MAGVYTVHEVLGYNGFLSYSSDGFSPVVYRAGADTTGDVGGDAVPGAGPPPLRES